MTRAVPPQPFASTELRPPATEPTASSAWIAADPPLHADGGAGTLDPAVGDGERYAFGEVFASGGIGVVRRGTDRRLGRVIAIKELQHDSPRAQQRFALEAAITARLQHPGIVPLYDLGCQGSGKPYYCMKLVDGDSLGARIERAQGLAQRLRLLEHVIAVADTIAYAHEQRVLHRDLKPANVLVGRFGETVVIDWGLAKDLSGRTAADSLAEPGALELRGDMTEAGTVMGTLRYMPPEQASGRAVDTRSDIYALGAILYHVLSGQPPFADVRGLALVARVSAGELADVRSLDPAIPRELAAITHRAMAREPGERYPSAAELAEDLRRFQAGRLVSAHAYSLGEVARLWLRRHRVAVAVAAILLLALLAPPWQLATIARECLRPPHPPPRFLRPPLRAPPA
jgi:serine/threonine protein kinase